MSILINFFNLIISSIGGVLVYIIKLLPSSPFTGIQSYISNLSPYMATLNWFLPVGLMLKITALWTGAIASYYIYAVALRWIKAIQ